MVLALALPKVCYCLVSFRLIKITSSLAIVVLGSAKHVLMVAIAAYAVDHLSSAIAHVGVAFFVPALFAYAVLMLTGLGDRSAPAKGNSHADSRTSEAVTVDCDPHKARADETTALKLGVS